MHLKDSAQDFYSHLKDNDVSIRKSDNSGPLSIIQNN